MNNSKLTPKIEKKELYTGNERSKLLTCLRMHENKTLFPPQTFLNIHQVGKMLT